MDERHALEAHARLRWFFRHPTGAQGGPLSTTEVIQGLLDRTIPVDSELCEAGGDSWRAARQIDQFRIASRAVRASMTRKDSQAPGPAPKGLDPPAPAAAQDASDEEDVQTKFYGTGEAVEEVADGVAGVKEVVEDDEEEIRTRCFEAGVPIPTPAPARVPIPAAAPVRVPIPTPAPVRVPIPTPAPAPARVPLPPPARVPLPTPARVPAAAAPRPIAPVAQKAPADDNEEEELRTAYYQPGGKKVEDDEDEVRTKYYQGGDGAPKALPTFADLAAQELANARVPEVPAPMVAPQPPVQIANETVAAPVPRAIQVQPQMTARDATQPAMVLPANAPRFTTQQKRPGIPWGRLALMAVVGALVGLFVVIALAFVLKLTGR